MSSKEHTTKIVDALGRGERQNAEDLWQLVYDELRARAQRYMEGERAGHTLQATAIVNEAYLRLVDQKRVTWKGKSHFMAVASEAFRRILVDHARQRAAAKRGGERIKVSLDGDIAEPAEANDVDIEALHEALVKLETLNQRQARVLQLRVLGGMSVKETAHVLEVSEMTVKNDYRFAKAWLRDQMGRKR